MALPTTPLVEHVGMVILCMARKVRTREGVTATEDFPEGLAATHPVVTLVVEVGKEVLHVERIPKEGAWAPMVMVLVRLLLAKVGMAVEVRPAVLLLVEVEGVVEVTEEVVHVKVMELRVGPFSTLLEGGAAKLIILLALLGIRQDLVSLRDILELLFGVGLLVLVWVVLEG